MTVPAVLRDVAQYGAYAAGRGRHAGLLVAVLLLAGCPANTVGPWGGADVTAARPPAHPATPPVPKPKPVRKAPDAATLAPALPMPMPGPPVTAGELTADKLSADQATTHLAAIGSDNAAQAAMPPNAAQAAMPSMGGTPPQPPTPTPTVLSGWTKSRLSNSWGPPLHGKRRLPPRSGGMPRAIAPSRCSSSWI